MRARVPTNLEDSVFEGALLNFEHILLTTPSQGHFFLFSIKSKVRYLQGGKKNLIFINFWIGTPMAGPPLKCPILILS